MNNTDTTSSMESSVAAYRLNSMIESARSMRVRHERQWYDNNYFDDGFHFRYVSASTGRVLDKSNSNNAPNKMRAIPKASKQIRGIANLLVGTNPHPVVLPERVLMSKFATPEEYQEARKWAQEVAKKSGHWLTKEFESDEVEDKLVEMIILAAKNSVSFIKITPDPINQDIIAEVRDAFDVYMQATAKGEDASSFMAESVAVNIQDVWNNPLYDEKVRLSVVPDNQFSGSKIKNSYMRSRFGTPLQSEQTGTCTINEGYIREFLNEGNYNRITQQKDAELVLRGKKMGSPIIRQIVTTIDGQPLYDHYTTLSMYPYAAFRFEPGYMYQVSQIERFMPSNKSLDAVVSRIEGFLHTMVSGTWTKRKGEGFRITNQYGGNVVEYDNTPPTPVPAAQIPQFVFQFVGLLNGFIEEQGLSINTLGALPSGVKAFRAIESLKEGEINNLQIPIKQLRKTVKRLSEIYLQYADDFFTEPREVADEDTNEPTYFDVIGQRAFDTRKQLNMPVEGMIPIKKDMPVKVEIDNGAAFTEEGKKAQTLELIQTLAPLFAQGALPPELLKILARELLDTFKTGSLQEVTQALDETNLADQVTPEDIEKIKIAMLEVMRDATGTPTAETPTEEQPVAPEEQNVQQM